MARLLVFKHSQTALLIPKRLNISLRADGRKSAQRDEVDVRAGVVWADEFAPGEVGQQGERPREGKRAVGMMVGTHGMFDKLVDESRHVQDGLVGRRFAAGRSRTLARRRNNGRYAGGEARIGKGRIEGLRGG